MTFEPLTILCGGLPASGPCASAELPGTGDTLGSKSGSAHGRNGLALTLKYNF